MSNPVNQISSCEVCGHQALESVLNLGSHPMCDDLVPIDESRSCEEYPIEIMLCQQCGTAHQRYQIPKESLFPKTYHYRSRFTKDVLLGMQDLVSNSQAIYGDLRGKKILDIGCNDGSLLGFFQKLGATTIGVEPTVASVDAVAKGHSVYNSFFTKDLAVKILRDHGSIDIITFTNVFAHIEDLQSLLSGLQMLLSTNTLIVIENHYLGSVLDRFQFDTFYHEHPRTYSCKSFSYIAKSLGIDLLDIQFPSRYGGNIRVTLGNKDIHAAVSSRDLEALFNNESKYLQKFSDMNRLIDNWLIGQKKVIKQLVSKHGTLKAKAFPGRAAILIKLLDLDVDTISAVYEKPGSAKIGHYVPGTRIPIKSDDDLFISEDQTLPLLNLAWHISTEIKEYLLKCGYQGPVIDIFSPTSMIS